MKELRKSDWIERARETFRFHRSKLLVHSNWTVTDSAKALNRSLGSVGEDLLIARFLRTHEREIEKFDYAYEALAFIRELKRKIELGEL